MILKCTKPGCNNEWETREDKIPKSCPKCKTRLDMKWKPEVIETIKS
jgi:DNA-directed RNA polymerase subunit RPC12/RpoP